MSQPLSKRPLARLAPALCLALALVPPACSSSSDDGEGASPVPSGTTSSPPASSPSASGSSTSPSPSGSASGSSPTPAAPAPLAWEPCDLHSEGGGPAAECTTAKTPLSLDDPQGPQIDVFVKRYRPKGGTGKSSLWMLQGGPGGSGYVFEAVAEAIGGKFPDVDFYLPDHRGTGRSTRLGCPQEAPESEAGVFISEAEWPACLEAAKAQYGESLGQFTTTNAANDIGQLIARAHGPGDRVFVYGASYGTYWAHRYLQLFPDQATGVIVDSIVPQGTSLARQDADADEALTDFLAVCAADPLCGGKLGPDPRAKADALWQKLKAGHCSELAPQGAPLHVALRRLFGSMLMNADLRSYIPPMLYRVDRCAKNDVAALSGLVASAVAEPKVDEMLKQWGFVLSNNITFSELWESPSPTIAELEAIRENAVASRDITLGMAPLVGTWPAYSDPLAGSWASTKTPMLMLQGQLDPATLYRKSKAFGDHFQGPHQHWVEIPTATHAVIASSRTHENRSCGTRIMMNFLDTPEGELDTSCIADVVPVSFEGIAQLTQQLFGVSDPWEGLPDRGRGRRPEGDRAAGHGHFGGSEAAAAASRGSRNTKTPRTPRAPTCEAWSSPAALQPRKHERLRRHEDRTKARSPDGVAACVMASPGRGRSRRAGPLTNGTTLQAPMLRAFVRSSWRRSRSCFISREAAGPRWSARSVGPRLPMVH